MQAGWQEILNRYQVKWAIVRTATPLALALQEIGWEVLYNDDTSIILRTQP
jgi:hypothetical protein